MKRRLNICHLLLCSLLLSGLLVSKQSVGQLPVHSVSMSANATILDNLSLITIRDVDLTEVGAVDGIIRIYPSNSSYAGLMRVTGTPGRSVRISYLVSETLIETGGNGGIVKAVYKLSGFTNDNQAASVLLDVGEANVQLGRDGSYYLWLGAEIDINDALPGNYVSEFVIEMEAN